MAAQLSGADIALLERLALHATKGPCHVPKADMSRLLTLVGFEADTVLWQQVKESDDPALFSPDAARMLVD